MGEWEGIRHGGGTMKREEDGGDDSHEASFPILSVPCNGLASENRHVDKYTRYSPVREIKDSNRDKRSPLEEKESLKSEGKSKDRTGKQANGGGEEGKEEVSAHKGLSPTFSPLREHAFMWIRPVDQGQTNSPGTPNKASGFNAISLEAVKKIHGVQCKSHSSPRGTYTALRDKDDENNRSNLGQVGLNHDGP
ncbi:hypothetical protein BJ684DRAFT_16988 [Piptocephalis cylindrospora]|uniref:Uncharacterized protein n=1 Tax=Piptocephalis cylindrospora TaxID=1907219 RepID=A0A4P9Y3Y0_9FUNG|nr:hypothetical protein BJ684DRAFT_16988 [Piptocephalis cylindrospora]|eukprot:RKP12530.1 hypothetical protein BJ684DRAFT_16988 [Piptocephalis cylindrospora]